MQAEKIGRQGTQIGCTTLAVGHLCSLLAPAGVAEVGRIASTAFICSDVAFSVAAIARLYARRHQKFNLEWLCWLGPLAHLSNGALAGDLWYRTTFLPTTLILWNSNDGDKQLKGVLLTLGHALGSPYLRLFPQQQLVHHALGFGFMTAFYFNKI